MEDKKIYFTPEQLAEWKALYGIVHKVTTADGLVAILKDPCQDMLLMTMVAKALEQDDTFMAISIIVTNAWLAGDEELKTSQRHLMGIEEKMLSITDPPSCSVKPYGTDGASLELICEGKKLHIKKAERTDLLRAEKLNAAGEPFETSKHLLEILKYSADELEEVKTNTRAYMGMLMATNKVKDQVAVIVEKL